MPVVDVYQPGVVLCHVDDDTLEIMAYSDIRTDAESVLRHCPDFAPLWTADPEISGEIGEGSGPVWLTKRTKIPQMMRGFLLLVVNWAGYCQPGMAGGVAVGMASS